jgi:hypothetical protein
MNIDQFDTITIRCPRLGGDAHFKFCRTSEEPFCHRIIVCWAERVDIGSFLARHYTPEQIHLGLERKSGGKLNQILNAADKARDKNER